MKVNNGYFIVVEGLDGIGKTTLIREVVKRLSKENTKIVMVSESMYEVKDLDGVVYPNQFSADLIRKVAKPETQSLADHTSQSLMVSAARRSHLQNVVIPLLNKGYIVLMDRYLPSTLFNYQHECKFSASIYHLATNDLGTINPKYLLLTADKDVAYARLVKRGIADIIDFRSHSQYDKIQKDYIKFVSNKCGVIQNVNSENMEDNITKMIENVKYLIDTIDDDYEEK